MTARDEAIEVMAQAYLLRLTGDDDRLIERIDDWDRGIAAVMYDAAESIIRADERAKRLGSIGVRDSGTTARASIEADLREHIAQEIEAERDHFCRYTATDPAHPIARAFDSAARIARGGAR